MRINNIKTPVFKTYGDLPKEEYDEILKKRANLVANMLLVTGGIATAGLIYANTKCKDKGGLVKALLNKIKNLFGNKPN